MVRFFAPPTPVKLPAPVMVKLPPLVLRFAVPLVTRFCAMVKPVPADKVKLFTVKPVITFKPAVVETERF